MKIDVKKIRQHEAFKSALRLFQDEIKDTNMSLEQIMGFFFSMGVKASTVALAKEFAEE